MSEGLLVRQEVEGTARRGGSGGRGSARYLNLLCVVIHMRRRLRVHILEALKRYLEVPAHHMHRVRVRVILRVRVRVG